MEKAKTILRNLLSANKNQEIEKSKLLELQSTIEAYDAEDIQDIYALLISMLSGKEDIVAKTLGTTKTVIETKIKDNDFTVVEMKLLALKFLLDGVNTHA